MIKNKTMFIRDNLEVLRGMGTETVDLIYLDPPFNSKKGWSAPVGSKAAGAHFKDAWTYDDIDEEWLGQIADDQPTSYKIIDAAGETGGKPDKSYLIYMSIRLMEMHRVLKATGSLCLHVDPTMSHSLKLVLDSLFGKKGFVNELIWYYRNASRGTKRFAKSHDVILWYAKGKKYTFNRKAVLAPFDSGMTKWRYTKGGQAGREMPEGKTPDDVIVLPSLNAMSKERTGYPTQKPVKLLEILLNGLSRKKELVLDPFCGCATTMLAAERHGRRWIGIDLSPKAAVLVRERFKKDGLFTRDIITRKTLPLREAQRSRDIKHTLYGRQEGRCNGCREHFAFRNFEIDHIVPTSKGGQDDDTNLQLLCGHCNRVKGDRLAMPELRARLKELVKK